MSGWFLTDIGCQCIYLDIKWNQDCVSQDIGFYQAEENRTTIVTRSTNILWNSDRDIFLKFRKVFIVLCQMLKNKLNYLWRDFQVNGPNSLAYEWNCSIRKSAKKCVRTYILILDGWRLGITGEVRSQWISLFIFLHGHFVSDKIIKVKSY